VTIGFVGFGEAGFHIAHGLRASGAERIVAYDLHAETPGRGDKIRARAREAGVELASTRGELAAAATLLLSVVTADSACAAATEMGASLGAGHVYVDLNSVAPATKRQLAAIVGGASARFVEGAIMAPVPGPGHRVPMLFNGASAPEAARCLTAFGMRIECMEGEVGAAAAVKMCRSIVIKGLEALLLEVTIGARAYGATDRVFASLHESFPGMDWPKTAEYMISRVFEHGVRRAAEMREVAETLRAAGIAPIMSAASAEAQDWKARFAADGRADLPAAIPEWLDALSDEVKARV
jgi:3-hydroxyisobutyrate dehydrogenase-like beta-hydroxyacid dehydrogenase